MKDQKEASILRVGCPFLGAKPTLQIDPIAAIARCVLTIVSTPTEYTCVVSSRIKWQKTVGF